jgi:hypothetical protein
MSKQPPTNEIKARAKFPSMPFPYLVTLLILLMFVLFRKHSGLVRHNLCDAAALSYASLELTTHYKLYLRLPISN